jgi:hypothetical protein
MTELDFNIPAGAMPIVVMFINSLAMIGTVFIGILFLKDRSLRNVPNCMVLSLASSDFLLSFSHFILSALVIARGSWSEKTCQVSGWTATFFGGTSLSQLGVLAFERYCATVRERPLQPKQATILVGSIFLWQLWVACIPFALQQQYRVEPSKVYCMSKWTFLDPAWGTFTGIVIFSIIASTNVIALSYYAIYHKVVEIKKLLKNVGQGESSTGSSSTGPRLDLPSSMRAATASTTPGTSSTAQENVNLLQRDSEDANSTSWPFRLLKLAKIARPGAALPDAQPNSILSGPSHGMADQVGPLRGKFINHIVNTSIFKKYICHHTES